MSNEKVCIVVSADFGDSLRKLDLTVPIWIVQSEQNDPVIAELRRAKAGNITSFRAQDFGDLADTVDLHHPGWGELEVHGLQIEQTKMVLAEYGSGRFISIPDGFVFHRKI